LREKEKEKIPKFYPVDNFGWVKATIYHPESELKSCISTENTTENIYVCSCDTQIYKKDVSVSLLQFSQPCITEHAVRRSLEKLVDMFYVPCKGQTYTVRSKWDRDALSVVVAIQKEALFSINLLFEIHSRSSSSYSGTGYHLSDVFYFLSSNKDRSALLYHCMCVMFGLNPVCVTFNEKKWKMFQTIIKDLGNDDNQLFRVMIRNKSGWASFIPSLFTDSNSVYEVVETKEKDGKEIQNHVLFLGDDKNKTKIASYSEDKLPINFDYSSIMRGRMSTTSPVPEQEGYKKLELLFFPRVKTGIFDEKDIFHYEVNRDDIRDRSFRLDSSLPIIMDYREYRSPLLFSYSYVRSLKSLIERGSHEY
jgi:hypothetical protein